MAEASSVEANALLAILRGDKAEAEKLLAGMLPGELGTLVLACNQLGLMASIAGQRASTEAARDADGDAS